jgi:REP element-mobilizing transposase RayT
MMNHNATRRRRSIRLPSYDYSQSGAYFVTIRAQDRECIFGEVLRGQVVLNGPGEMIQSVWRELPGHYHGVELDAFVVMPNHVHGIVILVGAGPCACPEDAGQPRGVAPTSAMSLPDVIHRFKSLTTAKYRRGVHDNGWSPVHRRLWQRNYYEHVVRSEEELDSVRQYVANNPACWDQDRENPGRRPGDDQIMTAEPF